jgi:hypothetical protein
MTIANDDFSLPSSCFILATSLPSSSQPGMQPCLGTHTWSPDLWSHYYTPNHCTVRPVPGRPTGLYTFCTRILTYSFASRMVYVTPGESYDVSPCPSTILCFFLLINSTRSSMLLISPGSSSLSSGKSNANSLSWMSTSWQTHRQWRRLGWRRRLYHIPGTFHPRQWPLAWLRYSISTPSSSNSSPLDLSRTEKIGVHFPHTNLVLPALTTFEFQGFSEYLKGFLYY